LLRLWLRLRLLLLLLPQLVVVAAVIEQAAAGVVTLLQQGRQRVMAVGFPADAQPAAELLPAQPLPRVLVAETQPALTAHCQQQQ